MEVIKSNESKERFDALDKIRLIFSEPKLFFSKIKEEININNSLILFLITLLILSVIYVGFLVTMGTGRHLFSLSNYYGTSLIGGSFLGILLLTFIYSGITQLVLILFKIPAKFKDTYNIITYSMIPYLIISLVPMIGALAIFYFLFLVIFGISEVNQIPKGKSALICLLPLVLIIGLLASLLFFLLWSIF
jgi:hypothetical protein